eukprot:TRINITY_DN27_c0_g1_i3.p1 TRINITY_DN27_c0_g1~~TRINITY_DN27_c0_g1_i3.p1  ORF type:complete len:290 (-),score=59.61 TRINITY_DN27_c0_g1_i3:144-1013(-)
MCIRDRVSTQSTWEIYFFYQQNILKNQMSINLFRVSLSFILLFGLIHCRYTFFERLHKVNTKADIPKSEFETLTKKLSQDLERAKKKCNMLSDNKNTELVCYLAAKNYPISGIVANTDRLKNELIKIKADKEKLYKNEITNNLKYNKIMKCKKDETDKIEREIQAIKINAQKTDEQKIEEIIQQQNNIETKIKLCLRNSNEKKLYEACLESQQALKLKVEEGQENELTACIKEVAKKTGLTDQQNYDEQMKCLNTKFLKPLSNKNYDYILFDCFAHPSSDDYERYTQIH